jgi:hypothetical protein
MRTVGWGMARGKEVYKDCAHVVPYSRPHWRRAKMGKNLGYIGLYHFADGCVPYKQLRNVSKHSRDPALSRSTQVAEKMLCYHVAITA